MKSITVVRDATWPEWSDVLRDGTKIGMIGRTAGLGSVRWVAFDAQDCYLGGIGGSGPSKALKAVVKEETEGLDTDTGGHARGRGDSLRLKKLRRCGRMRTNHRNADSSTTSVRFVWPANGCHALCVDAGSVLAGLGDPG
jgi:hypothetical protein